MLGDQAQTLDGAPATATTDHDFRHHDRNPDDRDAQQIHQHEGAATVLTGDIRKFPDIAQAHGRAGSGKNKGQT